MRLLYFCILLVFCSCSFKDDKKTLAEGKTTDDVLVDNLNDSLVQYIFMHGLDENRVSKINPNIEFNSGDTNNISFYKFHFTHEGFNYEFLAEHKKRAERSVYVNKEKLKVYRKNSQEFDVDSMDLNIDYTESEVYIFEHDPSHLLIVSRPSNWVGLMSKFLFFQIINTKEKDVTEFIRERG